MTLRARALAVLAATTAVAAACTGGSAVVPATDTPVEPVPVKVAFIQDGSIEEANLHGQPAFLGLKLALGQAVEAGGLPVLPEVVGFDTEGDPAVAAELAREVAEDPGYIAAVAAPYWSDTSEVAATFAAAGVPTLSLSGAPVDPGASWFRLVAGRRALAAAVAGYVRGLRGGGDVCLAGDGSPYARETAALLEPELGGSLVASASVDAGGGADLAASTMSEAGCTTVLWTGFGTGAAELRGALAASSVDALLVGSDGMKDSTYLELAGGGAHGTVVACACVDLSSSTEPAAQRFIHDYQADYAIPPGVFAAEGWDAGGLLLRAMRDGATTREGMLQDLQAASPYDGLAATYVLGGQSDPSSATDIHVYRAAAGRWLALRTGTIGLPVRTEGVLAVGSCRTGPPFAYRDRQGRLIGFDVELARALAGALGLALGWTRTSCDAGLTPVDERRVDVLLTPEAGLVPGTPTSRVFFSSRAAVVVPAEAAGDRDPLASLSAGDVVGLVPEGPVASWARAALDDSEVQLRRFHGDTEAAYRALEDGVLVAVVDDEAAAWAAIEHRLRLLVASTEDTGADDVMVVSAASTDLLPALDEALATILDDGTYQLLFGAYLPGATLPDAVGA